jgi:16S rRNA (uracil1498-N3)-methyltransferase
VIHDAAAPWRTAAALVLVDDLDAPDPGDAGVHHLRRVLRLRPGAEVCAGDGAGGYRPCVLGADGGLEPAGPACRVAPRPASDLVTVAFAPPKGDRTDLVVTKLTELGIDRILLVRAERSVVRRDGDRAGRALERLTRLSRAAAAQCRRLHLPEVAEADMADLLSAGAPLADLDGRSPAPGDRVLLVGPEGGWSATERALADARGGGRVRLAEHVLRAETAAIAAGVVLTLARVS